MTMGTVGHLSRPNSLAGDVLAFASKLTVTSGRKAGAPMVVLPHIEQAIKGTLRPGARTACISWPRKQSKSTGFAAVLVLAGLVGPLAVPRGQLATASASREQASLIFEEVVAFLAAEPELYALVNTSASRKTITSLTNGSTFKALSADATTAHGLGLDLFIMDEAAQQRNSELWDVLFTSQSARANPRAIAIGTRSQDVKHFFSEMIDYGQRVNAGEIDDPSFYCHVLAAPDDADWQDESVWRSVNPCLDAGVQDIASLRELATQAKRIPSKENVFRALHLNQAVDADGRFISSEDWKACAGPVDIQDGETCYGGLDLGSTQDLTSLALYFPRTGSVLSYCWLPAEPSLFEREKQDKAPYPVWRQQGFIETFPGRSTDRLAVAYKLAELCARFDVQGIAYDRWGISVLEKLMADAGIKAPLVPHGQGYKDFSPAVDAFETEVIEHRLRHGGNPVLTWAVGNVKLSTDPAGNRKFDKAKATQRIDPAVALAMAVGLAARQPVVGPSRYTTGGFFTL